MKNNPADTLRPSQPNSLQIKLVNLPEDRRSSVPQDTLYYTHLTIVFRARLTIPGRWCDADFCEINLGFTQATRGSLVNELLQVYITFFLYWEKPASSEY